MNCRAKGFDGKPTNGHRRSSDWPFKGPDEWAKGSITSESEGGGGEGWMEQGMLMGWKNGGWNRKIHKNDRGMSTENNGIGKAMDKLIHLEYLHLKISR